jgi:uncharacterized protein YqjF (DUF2071 family)
MPAPYGQDETMNSEYIRTRRAFVFLTARWQNLILITYDVEPSLLTPHLPRGLSLDTLEGRAFVSLVAFQFLDTRVLGLKIPFHVHFPEINLRFYVKNREGRGVCFIQEIVPHATTAWAARTLYNEPYVARPITSKIEADKEVVCASYSVVSQRRTHEIRVKARNEPYLPKSDSLAHFFKEHAWGYGRTRGGKTIGYRVEHPFWKTYPLTSYKIDVDFAALYGPKWATLNGAEPFNLTFAQGSRVKVYSPYSAIV